MLIQTAKQNKIIPIYIKLVQFYENKYNLFDYLNNMGISTDVLNLLNLKGYKILFLFDGLDEVKFKPELLIELDFVN